MSKHKDNIPPERLKDDWRYILTSPYPEFEDEAGELLPNSPLEQIAHDLDNPTRSPWLCVASLERECPYQLYALDFLAQNQKEIIKLRCFDGLSFQEIGLFHGTSKQAAHRCYNRAREKILNNLDEVRRVMNASTHEGVDVFLEDRGHFFLALNLLRFRNENNKRKRYHD